MPRPSYQVGRKFDTFEEWDAFRQKSLHARRQLCEDRLNHARRRWGLIRMAIEPRIRCVDTIWRCLPGTQWNIELDAIVDVWDLWRDVSRFVLNWRPARRRTAVSQDRVKRVWEEWERAAKELNP